MELSEEVQLLTINEDQAIESAKAKSLFFEVCVECQLKPNSRIKRSASLIAGAKQEVCTALRSSKWFYERKFCLELPQSAFAEEIKSAECYISSSTTFHRGHEEVQFPIHVSRLSDVRVYFFTLSTDGPAEEGVDDEESDVTAASHWPLPSASYDQLWDSLIYDGRIKEKLLEYATVSMLLAERKVKSDIISVNRVVLLYGPTGTGKTSLCKALAQKLAIRTSDRYTTAHLVEINSHSLFSRWFSESGKLVLKMFNGIIDMLEDPNAFVMILIDEVESLAHARKSASSGNEPTDSIRVVNALLTQLDQIKRFPNVLIFATSNMTSSIDLAFVDRADIKQFIGNPNAKVIYSILHSCLEELVTTKIVSLESTEGVKMASGSKVEFGQEVSRSLERIASLCVGLSGRLIRKLPVLALVTCRVNSAIQVTSFLSALEIVADEQQNVRKDLKEDCLG